MTLPAYLSDFSDDILVRCPTCSACGHLLTIAERQHYRLACHSCGANRDWVLDGQKSIPMPGSGPFLKGFELDLWLATPCCGETLWAYNLTHVAFLEQYISADQRPRPQLNEQRSNASITSRLPGWMIAGTNRERVLRGLAQLRKRAAI